MSSDNQDETTTIELDAETRRVLVQALDLLQRVAMGQWREVVEHSPNVLRPDVQALFGPASDAIMQVRSVYGIDNLRHPNASLGIRGAHREAHVAYDLWHALGGGMTSRWDDRMSGAAMSVYSDHHHPVVNHQRAHLLRLVTETERGEPTSWFEAVCPYEADDDSRPCRWWSIEDDVAADQPGCRVQEALSIAGNDGVEFNLVNDGQARAHWWVTVGNGERPILTDIAYARTGAGRA